MELLIKSIVHEEYIWMIPEQNDDACSLGQIGQWGVDFFVSMVEFMVRICPKDSEYLYLIHSLNQLSITHKLQKQFQVEIILVKILYT